VMQASRGISKRSARRSRGSAAAENVERGHAQELDENGPKKGRGGDGYVQDWWRMKKLPARGMKLNALVPNRAAVKKEVLDTRLDDVFRVVRQRRAAKARNMAQADWHSCVNRACVRVASGKWLVPMGYEGGGFIWLHPEEAHFLVDCGSLELRPVACSDLSLPNVATTARKQEAPARRKACSEQSAVESVPMSVQRSFASLLRGKRDMQLFQVYAYLRRAGYIIRRPRPLDSVEDLGLQFLRFSVWEHAHFRGRKQCGKPDFHLIVQSTDDPIPSVRQIQAAQRACSPIGLKIAFVTGSNVIFSSLSSRIQTPLNREIASEDEHHLKCLSIPSHRVLDEPEPASIQMHSDDDEA